MEPEAEREDDKAAGGREAGPEVDGGAGADGGAGEKTAVAAAVKVKLHWYKRISTGARMFFWSIYFAIFVVAAVAGIVIALLEMAASPLRVMHNPATSMLILVTGTLGEMWCLHRCLGIYMLQLPGKEYARWGVYIAGGALTLSFLLALAIVLLYLKQ